MKALVIAGLLAGTTVAHAEVPAPFRVAGVDVHAAMETYFDGEIRGGWVLTGMGAAGLVAGGLLYADDGAVARGASYVALGLGAAHLAAGVFVNIASRVRKRVYGLRIASAQGMFVEAERLRMRGVSRTLLVLKVVEVGLIAGGATMAGIGHQTDRPRLEGAGYALAVEAAATLVFDIFAARRAARYRGQLHANLTADAAGAPVVLLGRAFTF